MAGTFCAVLFCPQLPPPLGAGGKFPQWAVLTDGKIFNNTSHPKSLCSVKGSVAMQLKMSRLRATLLFWNHTKPCHLSLLLYFCRRIYIVSSVIHSLAFPVSTVLLYEIFKFKKTKCFRSSARMKECSEIHRHNETVFLN